MKKLFLALMLMLPMMAMAKGPVDAKYLKGGVPEENGVIVFRKSFSVPSMQKEQIYKTLSSYVKAVIVGPAIHDLRTRILSEDNEKGTIIAKVEEYMIFKNRFLALDRTRFRYQIEASAEGNKVNLAITQISYYYNENQEGKEGITYRGEEWITDKEAIKKDGTKLYPQSAKFRIKTIDRVEQIFEDCMDAFEVAANNPEGEKPAKKVRKGIVEE
jgi:hypothetical protein